MDALWVIYAWTTRVRSDVELKLSEYRIESSEYKSTRHRRRCQQMLDIAGDAKNNRELLSEAALSAIWPQSLKF